MCGWLAPPPRAPLLHLRRMVTLWSSVWPWPLVLPLRVPLAHALGGASRGAPGGALASGGSWGGAVGGALEAPPVTAGGSVRTWKCLSTKKYQSGFRFLSRPTWTVCAHVDAHGLAICADTTRGAMFASRGLRGLPLPRGHINCALLGSNFESFIATCHRGQ